jgi:hypothetical protein
MQLMYTSALVLNYLEIISTYLEIMCIWSDLTFIMKSLIDEIHRRDMLMNQNSLFNYYK